MDVVRSMQDRFIGNEEGVLELSNLLDRRQFELEEKIKQQQLEEQEKHEQR